jgi:hypothetical protein
MDAVKEDRKEKHDKVMKNKPIETKSIESEKPVEEVKSKKPKKEEVETTYHEEVKKATKKESNAPVKTPHVFPPLVIKGKKEVKEVVKDDSVKKPKSISLSAVQAIKKEKGVSLKEAWSIWKSQN